METWTCPSLGECRVPNPSKRVTHYVSDMDLMFRVANCEEPTNSRLERAGIREKIYFDVTPEFTVGACGGNFHFFRFGFGSDVVPQAS